tara:strand:+ start:2379 stop:3500 length:1122 start_codon:yes stop_codon:yes gene_type:complete
MKIGIITPFPPYRGGISKHSDNLYKKLIKSSDVTIFNFTRQYPNILFPGKNQYLDNFSSYDSNMIRIIDSLNPISWRRTAKKIIEKKIDRLIFRYWNPFFIPCYIYIIRYLRKKKYNIKIYSICDNSMSHENFFLQKYLMKKFIGLLDGVITMSAYVKNEIVSLVESVNCENLFLPILDDLEPPLDTKIAKDRLGLDKNKINFLFFGLIREYKGLDVLLNAINNIDKRILNQFNLLIAGESYINLSKYKKNIHSGLKNNIIWYNEYIPDHSVKLYFSAADYVILPYRSGSQSGIIPMSYHYGKPVIVSNVSGLVETVNDHTGFIFENENITKLTSILEYIINNHSSMNFKKINIMKDKLSTDNYAKKILKFIK